MNTSDPTPDYAAAVLAKAEAGGVHATELAALRRRLPHQDDPPAEQARELLDQLVIVKLNGGLGTSMGLSGPKSLLEVKPDASFLDILARQVLALRERHR